MPTINLTLDEFLDKGRTSRVIPLVREIFSGSETPIGLYEKLAAANTGSFLLESAEQGVWSRYSFIGVEVRGRLVQESDGLVKWLSDEGFTATPADLSLDLPTSALDAVEQIQGSWLTKDNGTEIPLVSGLVGHVGWDVIRDLETLPESKRDDNPVPRMSFSMIRDLVVVDHHSGSLHFVSNVFVEGQSRNDLERLYHEAISRIELLIQKVGVPSQPYLAEITFDTEANFNSNIEKNDFLKMIETAKQHVTKGDVFQVVLSQRFQAELEATPLDVYRVLRSLNPSPYMYLLNGSDTHGNFAIVGSSPESLVTVVGDQVTTHPIAGSRPRGKDWELDHANEISLLADRKETAEHLMLVDLARNDLSKVCVPNSVTVSEFMQVHRFSHIMHLVSTVEGKLRAGYNPVQVFKSTFPAGTLSGAPKPRALEIIEALEATPRGLYGGVCGYFDFAGNSDLAIAIRTAFIRGKTATVQAGAGIVLDSNPDSEFEETKSKARAVLRAIHTANSAKRV